MEENKEDKTNDEKIQKNTVEKNENEVEKEQVENNEANISEETKIEENEQKEETDIEDKEKEDNKFNIVNNQTKATNKTKKKIIIILIILLFCMFLSTIFAIFNMNNEKIIKGVNVEGIDLSNLSKEEAYNVLYNKFNEIKQNEISIKYNEYNKVIIPEQIEASIDIKKLVDEAHKVGRNNNIIIDNFQILKAKLFNKKIKCEIVYNEQLLNDVINTVEQEIPGKVEQYSYEIDGKKLIIKNGKKGLLVQKENLQEEIIKKIKEYFIENNPDTIINLKIRIEQPEEINVEKIQQEIYKEPEDAYIKDDPFEVHVEQNGLDFDISIDEAKNIVKEEKEEYEIPLKITKPKKTISDLGDKIFKETLSKYTTVFDAGNTNRASNIALAAKTINGTVLKPGETFSYNKVIGNTTKEKGYKLGGAYVNGQVVQAYGGGICQVSTTLYNAVLYANLEIVQRYNHSYAVSYVPAGRDATVSYGGKDFQFKNTRKYPIKIIANAANGSVSISIKGIKEENEYEIQLESKVLTRTPCKVVYQETNTLEEGKQKVIQKGYNGYKSITYKIMKENGKMISKETLSSDTYLPMNKIVMVGTKKKSTNTSNKNNNSNSNTSNQTQNEIPLTPTQDALQP